MGLTADRDDPALGHGSDDEPVPQNEKYLILPDDERRKPFTRPYRESYRHDACGAVTWMAPALAETYARDPHFYGATYCATCKMHRPVAEFRWVEGNEVVGS